MEIYLVGGAVRDEQLGLPVRERDWVVVGGAEKELESLGYRRVGRSFPVYLHPETNEEYALARTETKTGPGYRGFAFATEGVTLEEDLGRRDLTVNAMARDREGGLVDPYGGRADLEKRVLRHVSDAFREDPVRILRVARFAARFHERGFRVAEDTLRLMREMVAAHEADALVPERVWRETESALAEARPDIFIGVLRETGALAVIYPEIDALFGVPQPERWHPEIDTGVHVLMSLKQAAARSASPEARFAVLVHDLGKGTTPTREWPRHIGHEERGVALIQALCARLAVPNRYRELAILVSRFHGLVHRAAELKPGTLLKMLNDTDAFRRPERFEDFLAACEADARGRAGLEERAYPQAELLRRMLARAEKVKAEQFLDSGLADEALGEAIRRARIDAIGEVQRKMANSAAASKRR